MLLLVQHGIQSLFFQYYFVRFRLMATTLRVMLSQNAANISAWQRKCVSSANHARERRRLSALNAAATSSHTRQLTHRAKSLSRVNVISALIYRWHLFRQQQWKCKIFVIVKNKLFASRCCFCHRCDFMLYDSECLQFIEWKTLRQHALRLSAEDLRMLGGRRHSAIRAYEWLVVRLSTYHYYYMQLPTAAAAAAADHFMTECCA